MNEGNLHLLQAQDLLVKFKEGLSGEGRLIRMADDLIGNDAEIIGPFGRKRLIYADYVASGRSLKSVERFILEEVLPLYANSHTEASYCGGFMTGLRQASRRVIAESCGADEGYAVVFTGAGATAGLNRLVNLFGVSNCTGVRPRVIMGPYEHHSNILPWRESSAEIVEIDEAASGGPDLAQLDSALIGAHDRLTICAFSAASNVTGITSDVREITRRSNRAGAKIVWDYAGGGPYLPIELNLGRGAEIDAVVISPHKFIGGPASSGILIVRRDAVTTNRPTWPGGGTVKFVSQTSHDYSDSLETREEAGTPNILGDIRAALAFLVKEAIGQETISARNAALSKRVFSAWSKINSIEILGNPNAPRLPIFSFRIADETGGYVHQQLVTRMLSDRFGIQARGGCACAGPYVHRLLDIDDLESDEIRAAILSGNELRKPGFTRLNFSVLLSEDKVDYIIDSVAQLSRDVSSFSDRYDVNVARAIFYPRSETAPQFRTMR
ncbi:MAG: aminotransferase class V-fold PLP-dependent enzyme [Fimbriimonadaceae bacterium]